MARVLIVDDARFMRRVVADVVSAAGHEVAGEAHDGTLVLERYRELRPDVVTLDVTMPGKDGLTVLRELLEEHPDARVVMCTAVGQEPKVMEAMRIGAREYVLKPFRAERLEQAIAVALAP